MRHRPRTTYPKPPQADLCRRVYMLTPQMVRRIHAYGVAVGHDSEVAAVRDLISRALDQTEIGRNDHEHDG